MSVKGQTYHLTRESRVKTLTDGQRGYVAGILDGEGHLYIRGEYEGACYSRIRVRITDEILVRHLRKITGIGTISSHLPSQRRKDQGARKTIYEWNIGNRADVRMLLIQVLPYLTIKARRARWLLEFESLKDQGVGQGVEVRRLIDLIASEQSHRPARAGRDNLRVVR